MKLWNSQVESRVLENSSKKWSLTGSTISLHSKHEMIRKVSMVVTSSVDHYVSNDVISEGLSMEQLLRTKQNWTCLSLMLITWNFHNTIVDVPREHMQLHLHLYSVCSQPFWSSKTLPLSPSPLSLNSSFVPHTVLVLTYFIAQGICMFVCVAMRRVCEMLLRGFAPVGFCLQYSTMRVCYAE